MCCRVRDANPGEQLSGATVDSHAAYTQAVNSAEKACLVASLISPDEIVIMLANIWGDQQSSRQSIRRLRHPPRPPPQCPRISLAR